MDDICSVILEHVFVRQIYNVVKNKSKRKTKNDGGSEFIVIVNGNIDAKKDPIKKSKSDVEATNPIIFELVFEFSVGRRTGHLETQENC